MSATKHNASRRNFLSWSARMAALGTGAPFALNLATLGAASAQTATDYKALVCIFLYGGNDNHNTVIPYDQASYNGYQQVRGGIARARNTLLPLTPLSNLGGRQLALPPELLPIFHPVRCRPRCDCFQCRAVVAPDDARAISEPFGAAAAEAVFA